jgi:hypothetical protein
MPCRRSLGSNERRRMVRQSKSLVSAICLGMPQQPRDAERRRELKTRTAPVNLLAFSLTAVAPEFVDVICLAPTSISCGASRRETAPLHHPTRSTSTRPSPSFHARRELLTAAILHIVLYHFSVIQELLVQLHLLIPGKQVPSWPVSR